MADSIPYTSDELAKIDGTVPERGVFCHRCKCYIPTFDQLTEEDELELRQLNILYGMRALREKTNCPMAWAKIWALHPNGPHKLDPSKPCPYCELPLHPNAKQCLLCKMDWHDANNPIRRGRSIAEQILTVLPGAKITIIGTNALGSAMHYAELKRPDAGITFELQPLGNSAQDTNREWSHDA